MSARPVAIVTGATSGIGREASLALARAGFDLVLTGRRTTELSTVGTESEALGADVRCVPADLAAPDAAPRVLEAARAFGSEKPPVLVNNAGFAAFGKFHEMAPDDIDRMLALNLHAPIRLAQAFLPWALEQGGGRIINVLSVVVSQSLPMAEVYTATKMGLLGFSRSLSVSYRRQGIKVTTISPGAVDTPIWDDKAFVPNRAEMIPAAAVAEEILRAATLPPDRHLDEITLTPAKGLL